VYLIYYYINIVVLRSVNSVTLGEGDDLRGYKNVLIIKRIDRGK
jgi:hypothetical protein